jgi:hypothetical protein
MLSILTTNLKYILAILASFLILLGFCVMFNITYPYFSFKSDIDFLLTKQSILYIKTWRWAFYLHISSSLFALLFGWLQFVKPILLKHPKWHQNIGKIYIVLILFISAPSGLIMGFFANGGMAAKTSFIIISLLWWWFSFMAYKQIKNGRITSHINYTVRSYALTLSALTLRLYVLTLPYFFILPAKQMYTLVAWASWLPNIILAEFLIKKKVFNWSKQ